MDLWLFPNCWALVDFQETVRLGVHEIEKKKAHLGIMDDSSPLFVALFRIFTD
jgi:hypothetical protein